jgi:hypothetical protein
MHKYYSTRRSKASKPEARPQVLVVTVYLNSGVAINTLSFLDFRMNAIWGGTS